MPTDIEIARQARKQPIRAIAARVGLSESDLIPYGHDKAKVSAGCLKALKERPDGKLILVTAINPTPAGEGKTTTTIGLGDALNHIGARTVIALREPSLGPCFGMKGGATGGGQAQVLPMEDINLHFTGDFHAITAAHNLLAALIDNHLHWGNALGFDTRRIVWRRVMDMNDRALRSVMVGLGGPSNGVPRESGFDITVASEVMAILCLAEDAADLEARLGAIIVGYRHDKSPIFARDLKAEGALSVLLKDAVLPNLVQTIEGSPALIHGGPFANIAHGCNSVIATRAALKLGEYVVTEAGFGADLGAEKFFNIKCRKSGLRPSAAVIVATVRALKMNGGIARDALAQGDVEAVVRGAPNLIRHIRNVQQFGVPVVVAINHFATDTDDEIAAVQHAVRETGVDAHVCRHWAEGARGAVPLAEAVIRLATEDAGSFCLLYPDALSLREKIERIAQGIYRAERVDFASGVLAQLSRFEEMGYGALPVCMAKTQYSFSSDPALLGAPVGHTLTVRDVRLAAGAGFIVAICGDLMTMPGLPRIPAAERIGLDTNGEIKGLS